MALVAVAASKGSPGATTLALTLATVWPRAAVLAELDPAGTDLAYRLRAADGHPLDPGRGVASLATAPGDPLLDHVQRVASGLDVLVGAPPTGLAVAPPWDGLPGALTGDAAGDVVADCGRLHPGTPALPVLRAAAAVVLATRPVVDTVAHALTAARGVLDQAPGVPVHLVVVADVRDDRSRREITRLVDEAGLPVTVLGRFAHDREAVGLLSGTWSGRLDRTLLVRSARELAVDLANRLTAPVPERR